MSIEAFNIPSNLARTEEPVDIPTNGTKLLDWLTGEIKSTLSGVLKDTFKTVADGDISMEPLHGYCSFSQAIGAYTLLDKGLNPNPFSLQSLDENHVGHAVLTIELPKDGRSHLYLVDPTFRQFCDPDIPEHDGIPMPGYYLAETETGQEIIEGLLRNGYIEINAEKANEYIASFCEGNSPFATSEEAFNFMRNPPYDGCYENFAKNIMEEKGYLIPSAPIPAL